jgi:HK97 family phage major capsid protein
MSALLKLKQRRGELVVEMENLDKQADESGKPMTDEQRSKFDALKKEHNDTVAEITRKEELSGFRTESDKKEEKADPALPGKKDPEKRGFESFGEQLIAVARAESRGTPFVDPRLIQVRAATGMSEGVGQDGGFLVQDDFSKELLKRAYETGVLAARVKRIPISANANGLRMFGVDETSRADGSRWGGVQTYWADEAAQKTKSKPKFREMAMKLHKLVGLCYATDELLEDAVALEAIIREATESESHLGFLTLLR